jgi:tetratricopeptide (TPR) repeat protein
MEKHFSSQTLAEIFRDLYLEEHSGVLQLSQADTEKRIYFDRGMILFAESTIDDEDLGHRLVSEGKISPGALAEARRNITESKDLAQALVNRGLIGKEALSHTVRFIVERVVQSVFKWNGGTSRFNEGWLLQEIFESDILSTFETILKGISTMVGFDPIREAMRGMDNRLVVRQPTPVPLERLALSPAHGFILSRVDGTTSASDVLSILPQGEEDLACRFLFGLLVMGVLEYDPPLDNRAFRVASILRDHADQVALERLQEKMITEAYDNLAKQTPYEVLAVSSGASHTDIERAYSESKERFSRDRLLPRVREKMRSELSVIESRLVEAYLTMSQAPTSETRESESYAVSEEPMTADGLLVRVEMDKTKTKRALEESARVAEEYFNKARKYMREGDYYNAIQYGKLAISYNGADARFYYLVGDSQGRNPEARWQRMAEQNFVKATELDPWNADYRIILGRFYKRRGLKLRAKKQFEKALEVVPGHEEAVKEIAGLA